LIPPEPSEVVNYPEFPKLSALPPRHI
jgi:hypothetical protein